MASSTKTSWIFYGILYSCLLGVKSTELSFNIPEEQSSGYEVGNIVQSAALDEELSPEILTQLRFSLLKPSTYFTVHSSLGVISTTQLIDREEICPDDIEITQHCILTIDVTLTPMEYFRIIKIHIMISDINDNSPVFPVPTYHLMIPEGSLINTTFFLPSAEDRDSEINTISLYELESHIRVFEITSEVSEFGGSDLMLVIKQPVDRELQGGYTMKLIAQDSGIPSRTGMMILNVTIGDINDNKPVFQQSIYNVRVPESARSGIMLTSVKATDRDDGINSHISYFISQRAQARVRRIFNMNPNSGVLTLQQPVNYEERTSYLIPIIARDSGTPSQSAQALVNITVADENDNKPEIQVTTLTEKAQVREHSSNGTFIAHLTISDGDSESAGQVTCVLDSPLFELQQRYDNEFNLVVSEDLDREEYELLNVTILCTDDGSPPQIGSQFLQIEVVDINDQTPTFDRFVYYTMPIIENNTPGLNIVQVKARDTDKDKNAKIKFKLGTELDAFFFDINSISGVITAKVSLDREYQKEYTFTVIAADQGSRPLSATAIVYVRLADVNDNDPHFNESYYTFSVTENMPKFSFVGKVTASDIDEGVNSKVWYRLKEPSNTNFLVAHDTGIISTLVPLDRERPGGQQYQITVIAADYGTPSLSTSVIVTININDENDHHPLITSPDNMTVKSSYNTPVNVTFGNIEAYDADSGDNGRLSYFIQSGNEYNMFMIEKTSGSLKLKRPLDLSEIGYYRLVLGVYDNGLPPHTVFSHIVIHVTQSDYVPLANTQKQYTEENKVKPTYSINLIVVVVLSSISGLLSIILIVAIIRIRKQKIANHTYNCRAEVQKLFNTSARQSFSASWGAQSTRDSSVFSSHGDSLEPQTLMTTFRSSSNNDKTTSTQSFGNDRKRLVKNTNLENTNNLLKNRILGRCKAKNSDSDSGTCNCEDLSVHNSTPVLQSEITDSTGYTNQENTTTHPFHRFIATNDSSESVKIPSSISSANHSSSTDASQPNSSTNQSHMGKGNPPLMNKTLSRTTGLNSHSAANSSDPQKHELSDLSESTINGERLCDRIDEMFFTGV